MCVGFCLEISRISMKIHQRCWHRLNGFYMILPCFSAFKSGWKKVTELRTVRVCSHFLFYWWVFVVFFFVFLSGKWLGTFGTANSPLVTHCSNSRCSPFAQHVTNVFLPVLPLLARERIDICRKLNSSIHCWSEIVISCKVGAKLVNITPSSLWFIILAGWTKNSKQKSCGKDILFWTSSICVCHSSP